MFSVKKALVVFAMSICIGTTAYAERVQKAEVDWDSKNGPEVVVTEAGVPGKFKGAQGKLMARRAAIVLGYRQLAETLEGVQVDGGSTVGNMATQSDTVKARTSGLVKGAKIIDEVYEDGMYWVTLSVPLYGNKSVAAAVMSEVKKDSVVAKAPSVVTATSTVLTKEKYSETVEDINQGGFTGIVVDASNIGLECTMAPQILDTNERIIYGKDNIDMNFAVSYGLVQYSKDIDLVKSGNSRAGVRPLYVQAVGVKGGTNSVNPVNVVVTPEDADKILLLAGNSPSIMKKGLIVFVR